MAGPIESSAAAQPTSTFRVPDEPLLKRRGVWLVVAILVIAWIARDVIGPFVVAGVIAYAFSPVVSAGTRQTGWHRGVVVGIGYAIALFVIAAAAAESVLGLAIILAIYRRRVVVNADEMDLMKH